MGLSVPKSWKKDLLKKRDTEDLSESLKEDKAQMVKTEDRKIKHPGYFVRYLKKIIDHVSSLKDSSKRGLYDDLSDYLFEITPKLRKKQEIIFEKKRQDQFLLSAKKLSQDGTLLMYLGELFSEKYPPEVRRASVSFLIREIATVIASNKQ